MVCTGSYSTISGCKGSWLQQRWILLEPCAMCSRNFCEKCLYEESNKYYCCNCLILKFDSPLTPKQLSMFGLEELMFYVSYFKLHSQPKLLDRGVLSDILIKHFQNDNINNNDEASDSSTDSKPEGSNMEYNDNTETDSTSNGDDIPSQAGQQECLEALSVSQLKGFLRDNNVPHTTILSIKEKDLLVDMAKRIINKNQTINKPRLH